MNGHDFLQKIRNSVDALKETWKQSIDLHLEELKFTDSAVIEAYKEGVRYGSEFPEPCMTSTQLEYLISSLLYLKEENSMRIYYDRKNEAEYKENIKGIDTLKQRLERLQYNNNTLSYTAQYLEAIK